MPTHLSLKDIVLSAQTLMGVKAVWGRSSEGVMCFGSRGNPSLKDRAHFTQARVTAERAQTQPYFLTIGGGEQVPEDLRGRVLELVRATGVYGETTAFVRDEALRLRLAQWPVAVIISEVYSVVGEPRLVEELGFPDRSILTNAFDAVIHDELRIHKIWDTLKDYEVVRRWEAGPPLGFRDPGRVQLCGSMYPRVDGRSEEGKRIWKLSQSIERDARLRREVKKLNKSRNGGVIACEACGFSDPLDAMFDAHHQQPLAAGIRESRIDDLIVLCPTCHRWAHAKADDKLSPISVQQIRELLRASKQKGLGE